jgi:hypothetical protein
MGCSTPEVNLEHILHIQSQPLPVPAGIYLRTTWLDANWIVFLYEPEYDVTSQSAELVLYNLSSEEWVEVPFTKPDECERGRYGTIGRLPEGKLGFTYDCTTNLELMQIYYHLYDWDRVTGEFQHLYTYPRYFRATAFTSSPDGLEMIQEQGANNPQPMLHHLVQYREMTQFVPDFFRAASPSWSPDGQTIAFFANEVGPEEKSSIFTGWLN